MIQSEYIHRIHIRLLGLTFLGIFVQKNHTRLSQSDSFELGLSERLRTYLLPGSQHAESAQPTISLLTLIADQEPLTRFPPFRGNFTLSSGQ